MISGSETTRSSTRRPGDARCNHALQILHTKLRRTTPARNEQRSAPAFVWTRWKGWPPSLIADQRPDSHRRYQSHVRRQEPQPTGDPPHILPSPFHLLGRTRRSQGVGDRSRLPQPRSRPRPGGPPALPPQEDPSLVRAPHARGRAGATRSHVEIFNAAANKLRVEIGGSGHVATFRFPNDDGPAVAVELSGQVFSRVPNPADGVRRAGSRLRPGVASAAGPATPAHAGPTSSPVPGRSDVTGRSPAATVWTRSPGAWGSATPTARTT